MRLLTLVPLILILTGCVQSVTPEPMDGTGDPDSMGGTGDPDSIDGTGDLPSSVLDPNDDGVSVFLQMSGGIITFKPGSDEFSSFWPTAPFTMAHDNKRAVANDTDNGDVAVLDGEDWRVIGQGVGEFAVGFELVVVRSESDDLLTIYRYDGSVLYTGQASQYLGVLGEDNRGALVQVIEDDKEVLKVTSAEGSVLTITPELENWVVTETRQNAFAISSASAGDEITLTWFDLEGAPIDETLVRASQEPVSVSNLFDTLPTRAESVQSIVQPTVHEVHEVATLTGQTGVYSVLHNNPGVAFTEITIHAFDLRSDGTFEITDLDSIAANSGPEDRFFGPFLQYNSSSSMVVWWEHRYPTAEIMHFQMGVPNSLGTYMVPSGPQITVGVPYF